MSTETPTPIQSADSVLLQIKSVHASAYKLLQTPEQSWIERFVNTPFGQNINQKDTTAKQLRIDSERVAELRNKLQNNDALNKLRAGGLDAEELADCFEIGIKGETLGISSAYQMHGEYNFADFGQYIKAFLSDRQNQSDVYLEAVRILAERTNQSRLPWSDKLIEAALTVTPASALLFIGPMLGISSAYAIGKTVGIIKTSEESAKYARLATRARAEIKAPKIKLKNKQPAKTDESRPAPPPTDASAVAETAPKLGWWDRLKHRFTSLRTAAQNQPQQNESGQPTPLFVDLASVDPKIIAEYKRTPTSSDIPNLSPKSMTDVISGKIKASGWVKMFENSPAHNAECETALGRLATAAIIAGRWIDIPVTNIEANKIIIDLGEGYGLDTANIIMGGLHATWDYKYLVRRLKASSLATTYTDETGENWLRLTEFGIRTIRERLNGH